MRNYNEMEDDFDAEEVQPQTWWIDIGVGCAVLVVFLLVAVSWLVSAS